MKTVLEGTRAYLSGCIEYDTTDFNWRTEPTKVLRERFKINLFDPFDDPKQQWVPVLEEARKNKDTDKMAEIAFNFVRKDLANVDNSDFLIAYLPKGVPTTGTHHEIINATNMKRVTLLVCPEGVENLPIWYFGFISQDYMFGSWEELYNYLDEVNDRKHVDDNRWWLVYDLI